MDESRLKISKDHAWVRVETEDTVSIGITDFAQESLGEITYLELPETGLEVLAGDFLCAIGSSKAFVDLPSPVSGEVVAVNEELADMPNLVNESPYDKGWFLKIKTSDANELDALMDDKAYKLFIESETA